MAVESIRFLLWCGRGKTVAVERIRFVLCLVLTGLAYLAFPGFCCLKEGHHLFLAGETDGK